MILSIFYIILFDWNDSEGDTFNLPRWINSSFHFIKSTSSEAFPGFFSSGAYSIFKGGGAEHILNKEPFSSGAESYYFEFYQGHMPLFIRLIRGIYPLCTPLYIMFKSFFFYFKQRNEYQIWLGAQVSFLFFYFHKKKKYGVKIEYKSGEKKLEKVHGWSYFRHSPKFFKSEKRWTIVLIVTFIMKNDRKPKMPKYEL